MRILVTGANGYIGSKVVTKLLDMGHCVIATDLENNHIDNRAIFIKENIFENKNYFELFKMPELCLHLAWRDGFIHDSLNHINDISSHFNFIKSLMEAGLKSVAVMGSMHEVGFYEGAIDENTPNNPQTYYGVAKDALYKSLKILCKKSNVIFKWLRAFYIYGDDDYGNSIFCKIKKSASNGEKEFPFTTGKNKFDFVSIDELSRQISIAIIQNHINGIINVCSGKPQSLGEKVEEYIKENNLNIKLLYGTFSERENESPCVYGDNTKILKILNQKAKKILVTGSKGQLGFDCIKELKKRGYSNVLGVDCEELDITDETAVKKIIENYGPDIVMHNAAWTAVDKAEKNMDEVYKVNVLGTKYIAEACENVGAKMTYISTDYVFDGKGNKYYDTDDYKDGLSVYGRTKSQGEDIVKEICKKYFVVRTSWVFGINGNNFVKTMLNLYNRGTKKISVVDDQVGSPTYTVDLAFLLCDMVETDNYGVYHATNEGVCSWYEFACEIFYQLGIKSVVSPVSTEEYSSHYSEQAQRPLNSRMSKESLTRNGFKKLPDWKDALARYLKEIKANE